jgi:sulfite reductase (ferredoxin)
MSDDLLTLGSGAGSANEAIKLRANHLRGSIAQDLAAPSGSFAEDEVQLLKFHGTYQQDDRDERRVRKAAGLEKEHQFMVRSRIPGGALDAKQYLVHDELAARYGNATLRLTTRQGIQLRGVLKRDLHATIRAINDALLSTLAACGDVNRNVMACPAPAADPAHARAQEFARRIAERLAPRSRAYHEIWLDGEKLDAPEEEPVYGATYLPRKFKIGVAFPGDNCVDAYTQDLGFVAEMAGGELAGFTVLAGGGMGSTHGKRETFPRLGTPLCFARPDEVLDVAEAVVTIFRDYGDRNNRKHARMKYVIEECGIEWFRAELERRMGRPVEAPRAVRFERVEDHLGWHRQSDGAWYLGIYVENGRVVDRPASLLRTALRTAMQRFSPGVRLTGQQNVLLTNLPESARAGVDALFADHGVVTDPEALGLRRRAMACPALPTCGLAVAEAERALPALVRSIERELAQFGLASEPIDIRMTGCPNGCARPRMGDIGIVGRSLGIYDLFLGGDRTNSRLNQLFAQGVREEAIVSTLRPIFERWQRERLDGESLGDFTTRFGPEALREEVEVPA